jgi:hypothetical protein
MECVKVGMRWTWWTLVGARNEMTVNEIRRARFVDMDNVHLTCSSNRNAASALLFRILEKKSCKAGKVNTYD